MTPKAPFSGCHLTSNRKPSTSSDGFEFPSFAFRCSFASILDFGVRSGPGSACGGPCVSTIDTVTLPPSNGSLNF